MDKKQQEKIKEMFAGSDCSLFETDPEFTKLFLNFSQGEVPEKSRLTEKERMLCILSVLLGCQGKGEFRHMLHGALNTGLDPIAVKEILYQGTAYLEIGRTYDFLEIANQVIKEHNITLPLEPQGVSLWRRHGKTSDRRTGTAEKYQPLAGRQLFWRLLHQRRT